MKTTVASSAVLLLGAAFPAQAAIGGLGRFIPDLAGTIADLGVEIFGKKAKRSEPMIQARQDTPPGVPEFEYERCRNDLTGVSLTIFGDQTQVSIAPVPATCMNLANVMAGDASEGPVALPCGSDCLTYSDLTPEQFAELEALWTNL